MSPRVPRRAVAVKLVRGMIADGTLKPGAPVPSAVALAKMTGHGRGACRNALQVLLRDGTLVPGASPTARLRVPAAG